MYLEVKDVAFTYKQTESSVLEGFSISVEKGEIAALVGSSGSGKSTVLRLVAGLEMPDRGSIHINGMTVADRDTFIQPEKRKIGMVFQDYALFPHLTVFDNIAFGIADRNKTVRTARVKELLALISMTEYADRYPYQLSGGQQQRVAVARALAPNPHLLLMDEPFSNIDCSLRTKMRQEIRTILKTEQVTCLFVTHDMTDVDDMADRCIHIT